jgi:5-methyltetrahydrofolate--homocysteine methyltransferase
MDTLAELAKSVLNGDEEQAAKRTSQAMDAGHSAKLILDDGLIGGMTTVGKKFKAHEIFLPEVLMAAKAMGAGVDLLKPLLAKDDVPSLGKIVVGSVQGDLHDIGKNLVGIMLKGAGFEVFDLGNDVPPERFVEEAQKQAAPLIGMSALLTTTMPMMKQVVDLLREQGLSGKIRTIVGGAPVSKEFAREIGADAHGFDAVSAVEQVKNLTGRS